MKHKHSLLLAIATMSAVFSCSKEQTPSTPDGNPELPYKGVSVDFTTVFTKTSLGEPQGNTIPVLWEEGDKINIMGYYMDGDEEKQFSVEADSPESGASVTFTAVVPENAVDIYAVYPARACSALTKDDLGNVTVPVTINQSAYTTSFKDAHFCVAKTTLAEKSFTFKNVASIIEFEIEDASTFAKLEYLQMLALDFQKIRGVQPVSFAADGSLQLGTPTEASDVLDMNKNKLSAGKHYVSVLPANYTKGFAINLNYYDNPACMYRKAADLSTPKIIGLGKLDAKYQGDFYVTVGGAGEKTGRDWANAMGRDEFVAALAKRSEGGSYMSIDRYLHVWSLKGSTFHLGAGTYVLGDEASNGLEVSFYGGRGTSYCTINILGGYPAAGGGDRDVKNNVTKFSGDGKYHILAVKDRARLNIDGITFCDAFFKGACSKTAGKMGAALFLTDSFANTDTDVQRTAHEKGAARVNLTGCIFENNRNASANDTEGYYGGGSAIAIQKGFLHADKCIFRNNYDTGKVGCVATCGNYDFEKLRSELFFNACLFEKNTTGTSSQSTGHVINHKTKGILLGMYNCTFHENNLPAEDGNVHSSNVMDIRRSCIIANTTIYQSTFDQTLGWTGYPVRIDGGVGGMNRHIFANNVLQSLLDSNGKGDCRSFSLVGSYNAANGGRAYLKGNNILTMLYGKTAAADGFLKTDDDKVLGSGNNIGMTWDETLGVFKWNDGQTRYTAMSKAQMTEILTSSDIDNTVDKTSSAYTWGTTFYNWLVSLDALDKDAAGNTRPDEGWLSGSYQQL